MQAFRQWVCWKYETDAKGKPTKVPYQTNGRNAKVTDPGTWCSFEVAVAAVRARPQAFSGAGFVFSERDPYAGIDLDHSTDAVVIARQVKIVEAFSSYSEVSPSGQGLHIIIRVTDKTKVWKGRKRDCVELYCQGRFFTMTGNLYLPTPNVYLPIAERQALVTKLWEQMGENDEQKQTYQGELFETYSDDEIIQQALDAANGDKCKTLLDDNWRDLYLSQSEADLAFMNIIAYYSDCRNQCARIFLSSPLGKRKKARIVQIICNGC